MNRYYAIKRPDGSWVMARPMARKLDAWGSAVARDCRLEEIAMLINGCPKAAEELGYRCCEVSGFVEVQHE